ncbi:MAG TPA: sigma-70 family RNA polymerase sigma factor [Polyangiaceae bacterium]|nr:sigma-70 family RNA polymerase sigma factor [Polyangiaceae bacterium]
MVTPLKFIGDEHALLEALRAGHPGAVAALYDQYSVHVHRTLRSALGPDADLPDLLQEVFIRALDHISEINDPLRLKAWLNTIAVFTARAHIRRRARRRWLSIFSPQRLQEQELEPPCSDARFALRETYRLLDEMPVGERMAFVLRIIDGQTLPEAAAACGVSLATFKRRLARAEKAFVERVSERPTLLTWLERGTRWTLRKQG